MTAKNQKSPDTVKTLIRPRNPFQIFFRILARDRAAYHALLLLL